MAKVKQQTAKTSSLPLTQSASSASMRDGFKA